MYLQLLQDSVDSSVKDILEHNDSGNENAFTFQSDGVPPQYILAVREYFN